MFPELWDGCFYVDESVNGLEKGITVIGAGVGIRQGCVKLLDYCAIAYKKNNRYSYCNGNGNGYWRTLALQSLRLIEAQHDAYRPSQIYVCNHTHVHIDRVINAMKASSKSSKENPTKLTTDQLKELENFQKLFDKMCAVTSDNVSRNIYRAKQEVGDEVKKKIAVKIKKEDEMGVLEGRILDLKLGTFI